VPASSIKTITFNPGPSQLTPWIIQDIQEIASSGFLSVSHRGSTFMDVSRRAIEGLYKKMNIPSDYLIFYHPSASVAMDTLLRNLVMEHSFHFVCGGFSSLFFETAKAIVKGAVAYEVPWNKSIQWDAATLPAEIELIAITHNETSTGLMWPREEIHALRERYKTPLIAVDVASSFGVLKMDWQDADVWFGSVQKCLGLPSGLGFLVVGPRAMAKSESVLKNRGGIASWQRFATLAEKMRLFQTPETPNMLAIALLARQMERWNLDELEKNTYKNAQLIYAASLPWQPYVVDEKWRSLTTLNFIVDDPAMWSNHVKKHGFVLGSGYGSLKDSCIRIANFPAITDEQIEKLLQCMRA